MGCERRLVMLMTGALVAIWLMTQGGATLAQTPAPTPKPAPAPAKPAAAVPAPATAPALPPAPVPPEKMDPKALTYPKSVIQQEIEVGKPGVVSLLTQFLTRSAASTGSEGRPATPALDSEAVKKAMSSITRFLVVSMVPGADAGGTLDGEAAASHYASMFSQFNWISVLRTVRPQEHSSFHLMLAQDSKGLFFVTADATRILATLAISDGDLNPLLEVLAPTFGAGIMPVGLGSGSGTTAPPKPQ